MEETDIYTEKLMNMILDIVDDIIIIHDSEHTIIWMNRSAEKAFGISAEEVIGKPCYSLFNNSTPCNDCAVSNVASPGSTGVSATKRRILPKTGIACDCRTMPYYNKGQLKLVVQHLRPVCDCATKG